MTAGLVREETVSARPAGLIFDFHIVTSFLKWRHDMTQRVKSLTSAFIFWLLPAVMAGVALTAFPVAAEAQSLALCSRTR